MNACVNHSENAAIEHCEVCDKALCGLCLWYTEDGHRLCETHAKAAEVNDGAVITPPSAYAEAVENSLQRVEDVRDKRADGADVHKGNQMDLSGLTAAFAGAATLLMCSGFGAYCMPFLALGLGIYAYTNADKALDKDRTQKLAIAGMAGGGLMVLFIAGIFLMWFFMMMFAVFASSMP